MRKMLIALVPAAMLAGCTTQQLYGTTDPQIIAMKRAQLDADLAQSNAQLQQTLQTNNQILQQQNADMNQVVSSYTRTDVSGKSYFCQRLSSNVVNCRPL